MKNKLNMILGALALSTVAPLALASSYDVGFDKPYAGIEVIQTNQKHKDKFGGNLFTKNPQNYGVFAGFNVWKALGLEIGYEGQPRHNRKNLSFAEGKIIAGAAPIIADASPVVLNSFVGNRAAYVGLFADADKKVGNGKMNFKAMAGLSATTIKANYRLIQIGEVLPTNMQRNFKKTKPVFMAKLSSTYTFGNNVGVRMSLNYRNMASFKIKAKEAADRQIKLKDMFGVGLGLTYSM